MQNYGGIQMKKIYERVLDLVSKRKIETLQSELAKQAGIVDYIAMMSDVEIPMEDENNDELV